MLATEWLVLRSIHFILPKVQIVSKYFINKPYHFYFFFCGYTSIGMSSVRIILVTIITEMRFSL